MYNGENFSYQSNIRVTNFRMSAVWKYSHKKKKDNYCSYTGSKRQGQLFNTLTISRRAQEKVNKGRPQFEACPF